MDNSLESVVKSVHNPEDKTEVAGHIQGNDNKNTGNTLELKSEDESINKKKIFISKEENNDDTDISLSLEDEINSNYGDSIDLTSKNEYSSSYTDYNNSVINVDYSNISFDTDDNSGSVFIRDNSDIDQNLRDTVYFDNEISDDDDEWNGNSSDEESLDMLLCQNEGISEEVKECVANDSFDDDNLYDEVAVMENTDNHKSENVENNDMINENSSVILSQNKDINVETDPCFNNITQCSSDIKEFLIDEKVNTSDNSKCFNIYENVPIRIGNNYNLTQKIKSESYFSRDQKTCIYSRNPRSNSKFGIHTEMHGLTLINENKEIFTKNCITEAKDDCIIYENVNIDSRTFVNNDDIVPCCDKIDTYTSIPKMSKFLKPKICLDHQQKSLIFLEIAKEATSITKNRQIGSSTQLTDNFNKSVMQFNPTTKLKRPQTLDLKFSLCRDLNLARMKQERVNLKPFMDDEESTKQLSVKLPGRVQNKLQYSVNLPCETSVLKNLDEKNTPKENNVDYKEQVNSPIKNNCSVRFSSYSDERKHSINCNSGAIPRPPRHVHLHKRLSNSFRSFIKNLTKSQCKRPVRVIRHVSAPLLLSSTLENNSDGNIGFVKSSNSPGSNQYSSAYLKDEKENDIKTKIPDENSKPNRKINFGNVSKIYQTFQSSNVKKSLHKTDNLKEIFNNQIDRKIERLNKELHEEICNSSLTKDRMDDELIISKDNETHSIYSNIPGKHLKYATNCNKEHLNEDKYRSLDEHKPYKPLPLPRSKIQCNKGFLETEIGAVENKQQQFNSEINDSNGKTDEEIGLDPKLVLAKKQLRKEDHNLEGPWPTPDLAKVVQEMVVSKHFNLTESQNFRRREFLYNLEQKDRTLVFDSSQFLKNSPQEFDKYSCKDKNRNVSCSSDNSVSTGRDTHKEIKSVKVERDSKSDKGCKIIDITEKKDKPSRDIDETVSSSNISIENTYNENMTRDQNISNENVKESSPFKTNVNIKSFIDDIKEIGNMIEKHVHLNESNSENKNVLNKIIDKGEINDKMPVLKIEKLNRSPPARRGRISSSSSSLSSSKASPLESPSTIQTDSNSKSPNQHGLFLNPSSGVSCNIVKIKSEETEQNKHNSKSMTTQVSVNEDKKNVQYLVKPTPNKLFIKPLTSTSQSKQKVDSDEIPKKVLKSKAVKVVPIDSPLLKMKDHDNGSKDNNDTIVKKKRRPQFFKVLDSPPFRKGSNSLIPYQSSKNRRHSDHFIESKTIIERISQSVDILNSLASIRRNSDPYPQHRLSHGSLDSDSSRGGPRYYRPIKAKRVSKTHSRSLTKCHDIPRPESTESFFDNNSPSVLLIQHNKKQPLKQKPPEITELSNSPNSFKTLRKDLRSKSSFQCPVGIDSPSLTRKFDSLKKRTIDSLKEKALVNNKKPGGSFTLPRSANPSLSFDSSLQEIGNSRIVKSDNQISTGLLEVKSICSSPVAASAGNSTECLDLSSEYITDSRESLDENSEVREIDNQVLQHNFFDDEKISSPISGIQEKHQLSSNNTNVAQGNYPIIEDSLKMSQNIKSPEKVKISGQEKDHKIKSIMKILKSTDKDPNFTPPKLPKQKCTTPEVLVYYKPSVGQNTVSSEESTLCGNSSKVLLTMSTKNINESDFIVERDGHQDEHLFKFDDIPIVEGEYSPTINEQFVPEEISPPKDFDDNVNSTERLYRETSFDEPFTCENHTVSFKKTSIDKLENMCENKTTNFHDQITEKDMKNNSIISPEASSSPILHLRSDEDISGTNIDSNVHYDNLIIPDCPSIASLLSFSIERNKKKRKPDSYISLRKNSADDLLYMTDQSSDRITCNLTSKSNTDILYNNDVKDANLEINNTFQSESDFISNSSHTDKLGNINEDLKCYNERSKCQMSLAENLNCVLNEDSSYQSSNVCDFDQRLTKTQSDDILGYHANIEGTNIDDASLDIMSNNNLSNPDTKNRLKGDSRQPGTPKTRTKSAESVSQIFARGVSGKFKKRSASEESIQPKSFSCVEILSPEEYELKRPTIRKIPKSPPPPPPHPPVFIPPAPPSTPSFDIIRAREDIKRKRQLSKESLSQVSRPIIEFDNIETSKITTEDLLRIKEKLQQIRRESNYGDDTPNSTPTIASDNILRESLDLLKNLENLNFFGSGHTTENDEGESHVYENVPDIIFRKQGSGNVPLQFMDNRKHGARTSSSGSIGNNLGVKDSHVYENLRTPERLRIFRKPRFSASEFPCLEKKKSDSDSAKNSQLGSKLESKVAKSEKNDKSNCSESFLESFRILDKKKSASVHRRKPKSLELLSPRRSSVATDKPTRKTKSETEKSKTSYRIPKGVRVGILKKQRSDITGVKLQKLKYFDHELPTDRRRSYSLGDELCSISTKEKYKKENNVSSKSTSSHSTLNNGETSAKLNSTSTRNKTIDKFLQNCAPCITSTAVSTLDLTDKDQKDTEINEQDAKKKRDETTEKACETDDSVFIDEVQEQKKLDSNKKRRNRLMSTSSEQSILADSSISPKVMKNKKNKLNMKKLRQKSSRNTQSKSNNKEVATKKHYLKKGEQKAALNNKIENHNSSINSTSDTSGTSPPGTTESNETGANGVDYYSELLDTILHAVDTTPTPKVTRSTTSVLSATPTSDCGAKPYQPNNMSETSTTATDGSVNAGESCPGTSSSNDHSQCPASPSSDSDSGASVDSELAEIRRRVTERFPPAPRDGLSQDSVLASPLVCPLGNSCKACGTGGRCSNVFTFEINECRDSSFVKTQHEANKNNEIRIDLLHSTSCPHSCEDSASFQTRPSEGDLFRSACDVCKSDQDEEEYWSAVSEDGGRKTPCRSPKHKFLTPRLSRKDLLKG